MNELINNPIVISTVIAALSWLGGKLWGKASAKTKSTLDSAIESARSVMANVIATAAPTMPLKDVRIQLAAAAAIQLARLKIYNRTPLIQGLVDAAVNEFLKRFVDDNKATIAAGSVSAMIRKADEAPAKELA